MDAIITALGGLLLRALPTFLLVVFLHFYLKRALFAPLDRVLEARRQATEGTREAALASLEASAAKADECEATLRSARADIYREQEETRRRRQREQAAAVEQARRNAFEMLKQARAELAAEAAQTKAALAAESSRLAEAIAAAILGGRARA